MKRTWLLLPPAAAVVIFDAWEWGRRVLDPGFQSDFLVYYVGALVGRTRGWDHLYDFPAQRQALAAVAPGLRWSGEWGPFWNPPPLAWLVSPLTAVPYPLAFAAWSVLMLGAWLLAWWLLAPGAGFERALHLVLLLALFPWLLGMALGQADAVLAVAVAGGSWLLSRQRPVAAGIVLSLVAVKPHPLLLLPVALVVAWQWRAGLAWATATLVMVAVSIALLGTQGLQEIRSDLSIAAGWPQAPITLQGWLGPGWPAQVTRAGAVVLTLVVAWRWRQKGPVMALAAGLVGSSLTAQFLHLQDLALLAVAGWLALGADASAAQRRLAVAGFILLQAAVAVGPPLVLLELAWLGWMALGPAASGATWRLPFLAPSVAAASPTAPGQPIGRPGGSGAGSS